MLTATTREIGRVVGVRFAAGLPAVLAIGAALAGWWVLAAIVLAAVLAFVVSRMSAAVAPTRESGGMAGLVLRGTTLAARLALLAVFGSLLGSYVSPTHSPVAAAVVPCTVSIAYGLGARMTNYARWWVLGLVLVSAFALIVLCIAVEPAGNVGSSQGIAGLVPATAVIFPVLVGIRTPRRVRSAMALIGSIALGCGVAAAALYQLGPARLGLSPRFVLDLLNAADAKPLALGFTIVIVIMSLSAALLTLDSAIDQVRIQENRLHTAVAAMVCGAGSAGLAATVRSVDIVLIAATAALCAALLAGLIAIRRGASPVAILSILGTTILLVAMPQRGLLGMILACACGIVGVIAIERMSRRALWLKREQSSWHT